MRIKNYDYYLIVATALVLFAVGVVCIYAITYYNYLAVDPQWTRTLQYARYVNDMNSYLYPLLLLLLITLGLCIPKRLLEQDILVKFSAVLLGATIALSFLTGIETGLGFILAVAAGVQGTVLALTFKRSRAIRFEKEGHIVRLGSSLLHLGLVILVLNFVALRESTMHMPIFWFGTALISVGNIFSFYPERVTSFLHYE